MARPAGFEPATHGLEGRCSIQLSYGRIVISAPCFAIMQVDRVSLIMVGVEGFEPPTLWSQTRCATKLRYTPIHCLSQAKHLLRLPQNLAFGTIDFSFLANANLYRSGFVSPSSQVVRIIPMPLCFVNA